MTDPRRIHDDTGPIAPYCQVRLDVGLFETSDPFRVSSRRLSRR